MMQPIDFLYRLLGALSFIGLGVAAYTRFMTKIKGLEMRLEAMEKNFAHIESSAELQEDKIMKKLEEIMEKIYEVKIQLQNKQDRPDVNFKHRQQ